MHFHYRQQYHKISNQDIGRQYKRFNLLRRPLRVALAVSLQNEIQRETDTFLSGSIPGASSAPHATTVP